MNKKSVYLIIFCSALLLHGCKGDSDFSMVSQSDSSSYTASNLSEPDATRSAEYQILDVNVSDIAEVDISSMNAADLTIDKDPATGIPRTLSGSFSSITIASPEDALKVLLSVCSVMNIKTDTFCCIEIDDERNNYTVYTLGQLYNGVLVDNGLFTVVAEKATGKPVSVSGLYQDVSTLDTVPAIDSKKALESVKLKRKQKVADTNLVVFGSEEKGYLLCWKYTVTSNNIALNKTSYVNAQTGELVEEVSTTIN